MQPPRACPPYGRHVLLGDHCVVVSKKNEGFLVLPSRFPLGGGCVVKGFGEGRGGERGGGRGERRGERRGEMIRTKNNGWL